MANQIYMAGWSDDAKQAITDNPDYFVWWYTVKSVACGVFVALAAYWFAKSQCKCKTGRKPVRR